MKHIKYTVAIPTYQRPAYLTDLLQDLSNQQGDVDFSKWEVLICDNDSKKSAKAVVEMAICNRFGRWEYLEANEQNISLARNKLFGSAKGDALVYLDDDQRISSDFCLQVERFWKKWAKKITGGKFEVIPTFDSAAKTWVRDQFFSVEKLPNEGAPLSLFSTNGCILNKREITDLFPVFDPDYGRSGGEDFEFFLRLKNQGHAFISAPSIKIFERISVKRETLAYLIKRNFFRSFIFGKLIKNKYFGLPRGIDFFFILMKLLICLFCFPFCLFLGKDSFLRFFLTFVRQVGKLVGFFNFQFKVY